MNTLKIKFSARQAELVQSFFDDWFSYYDLESILEPENLSSDDNTEEQARAEIAMARASSMDGCTLTIVHESALYHDVIHELEMLTSDFRADPAERRTAAGVLKKILASTRNVYA